MLKSLVYLTLLFTCFTLQVNATAPPVDIDSFKTILKIEDQAKREKKLVGFIKACLQDGTIENLPAVKAEIDKLFLQFHVDNSAGFEYFIESIYQRRLTNMDDAEAAMLKAVKYAAKNEDHFLMYSFLSHLAFIQTDEGNAIDAVTSYGLAKKEAVRLNDPHLQLQVDVNMSDVYYKNSFYNQSLFYLNQAEALNKKNKLNDEGIDKIIYYNKSENFFRMNKPDSLKKYHDKLQTIKGSIYKLYTYQKRTEYYLYLLQYDFKNAIKLIKAMKNDTLYKYNEQDQLNLADAYYNGDKPDSSVAIINDLLVQPLTVNHPEINYHLYKVLGQIAEARKDYKLATYNFQLSLEQSEDMIRRFNQVGNISSQIKIDEIEGSYLQKDEIYKRERLWLIFAVVVAVLVIVIGTMSYHSARQKRRYEKLLFTTQKKELAFINSHEVRRHLSNILGIIDIIKNSENKQAEYKQFEDHLFCSAESMDKAIKNISAKLDEQLPDSDNLNLSPASKSTIPV
jgi:hypothetical protein